MKIKIKLLENGLIPKKQTAGSAGYDIFAKEEIIIKPKDSSIILTGFCLEIPIGIEGQIRSRSGLAFKNKIFVLNSPGTIDSDYRNEIGVLLYNAGNEEFVVQKHSRIAQLIFAKYESFDFVENDNLNETERTGGWGSTGK